MNKAYHRCTAAKSVDRFKFYLTVCVPHQRYSLDPQRQTGRASSSAGLPPPQLSSATGTRSRSWDSRLHVPMSKTDTSRQVRPVIGLGNSTQDSHHLLGHRGECCTIARHRGTFRMELTYTVFWNPLKWTLFSPNVKRRRWTRDAKSVSENQFVFRSGVNWCLRPDNNSVRLLGLRHRFWGRLKWECWCLKWFLREMENCLLSFCLGGTLYLHVGHLHSYHDLQNS